MCYLHSMNSHHTAVETEHSLQQSSWGLICMLAAQHVVVLFSGIILVPVMLVNIYDVSDAEAHYLICATALCAAAATLLQLIKNKNFGLGSPMFMGTSGAFMSCAHSAMQMGGIPLLMGMVLVSSPFQVLFSYLIRFMRHILTPTVGGVIIMLAVVGLLKDSVATWGDAGHLYGQEALLDIMTGLVTVFIMVGVEWFSGKRLRPWGLTLGILAGTLVAALSGLPVIEGLEEASWFGLPRGEWPGFTFSPDQPEHWTLSLTFALAVLATSIKYAGDAMILQKVAKPEQKKVDYDALQGGLYANSVGMLLAGFAGGMPSSSHSANIPLMGMTGVATRRLAAVASLMLAGVALSPKALLLLVHIPEPVIGGVGVVLVAHLFSSGLQLVATEINHRNGVIAGLSLCVGLIASSGKFFPYAFPNYLDPLVKNGVALGGLVAVLLTLMTHYGTHRAYVIRLKAVMEQLSELQKQLPLVAGKLGLSGHDAGYLELACEEIFMFMRDEFQSKEVDGVLSFAFRSSRAGIRVEISGRTKFETEADELAARELLKLESCTDDDLKSLGLILLGRIADNVSHITISGHSYISFTMIQK